MHNLPLHRLFLNNVTRERIRQGMCTDNERNMTRIHTHTHTQRKVMSCFETESHRTTNVKVTCSILIWDEEHGPMIVGSKNQEIDMQFSLMNHIVLIYHLFSPFYSFTCIPSRAESCMVCIYIYILMDGRGLLLVISRRNHCTATIFYANCLLRCR